VVATVQKRFKDLGGGDAGKDLSNTTCAGSAPSWRARIRQFGLQAGELKYNPDARVLNYSIGICPQPGGLR